MVHPADQTRNPQRTGAARFLSQTLGPAIGAALIAGGRIVPEPWSCGRSVARSWGVLKLCPEAMGEKGASIFWLVRNKSKKGATVQLGKKESAT